MIAGFGHFTHYYVQSSNPHQFFTMIEQEADLLPLLTSEPDEIASSQNSKA
jgi:hypothetical protein